MTARDTPSLRLIRCNEDYKRGKGNLTDDSHSLVVGAGLTQSLPVVRPRRLGVGPPALGRADVARLTIRAAHHVAQELPHGAAPGHGATPTRTVARVQHDELGVRADGRVARVPVVAGAAPRVGEEVQELCALRRGTQTGRGRRVGRLAGEERPVLARGRRALGQGGGRPRGGGRRRRRGARRRVRSI